MSGALAAVTNCRSPGVDPRQPQTPAEIAPAASLPLTAEKLITRYDGRIADQNRPVKNPDGSRTSKDGRLGSEELNGDLRRFTSDLLSLSSAERNTVLGALTSSAKELVALRLQVEAIDLLRGNSGLAENEAKNRLNRVTEVLGDKLIVNRTGMFGRCADEDQVRFNTALAAANPKVAELIAITRDVIARSPTLDPALSTAGPIRIGDKYYRSTDSIEFGKDLGKSHFENAPRPTLPSCSKQAIAENPELYSRLEKSVEKSRCNQTDFQRNYEQIAARVAETIGTAEHPLGLPNRIITVLQSPSAELKGAKFEIIGLVNSPAQNGVAVRFETSSGEQYFSLSADGTQAIPLDPSKVRAQTLFVAAKSANGEWNVNQPAQGAAADFVARQNAAESVRERTARFINTGTEDLRQQISQGLADSPQSFISQHRGCADPAKTIEQLKGKLVEAQKSLEKCGEKTGTPEALKAGASIGLCSGLIHSLEGRAKEADSFQKIWEEKLSKHPEWRNASFKQVPAQYLDLATGEQKMLPVFSATVEGGKTVLVDLRDGGVYQGDSNQAALSILVSANRYPRGFIKYSPDNGQSINTVRSYGSIDTIFDVAEKGATVLGLSALAAGAVPSPDPATKGYAVIAGTTSAVVSAATNGRRLLGDLAHERSVDSLDLIGTAAPILGAGSGLIRSGRPIASMLKLGAAATALGADGYGTYESVSRLYNALDLNNPNLSAAERAERSQQFVQQTAVNVGLTLFANRGALKQGLAHAGNAASQIDAKLTTAIQETVEGARLIFDSFNPPLAYSVAGGRSSVGGVAAVATAPGPYSLSRITDAPVPAGAGTGTTAGRGMSDAVLPPAQPNQYDPEKGVFLSADQLQTGKSYFSENLGWVEYIGQENGLHKFKTYDQRAGRMQFSKPGEITFTPGKGPNRFCKQEHAGFLAEAAAREYGVTFDRAAVWFGIGELHNQFMTGGRSPRDKAVYEELNKVFKTLSPNEELGDFLTRAKKGFTTGPLNPHDIDLAQIFLVAVNESTGVDYVRVGVAGQTARNSKGSWTSFDSVHREAALFDFKSGGGKHQNATDEYLREGLWNAGVKIFDGIHPRSVESGASNSSRIHTGPDYYPEKRRKGADQAAIKFSEDVDQFKAEPTKANANRLLNQTISGIHEFLHEHAEMLKGKSVVIVPVPSTSGTPGASDAFAKALGSALGLPVRSTYSNQPVVGVYDQVGLSSGNAHRDLGSQKSKGGVVNRMRNAGARFEVTENLSDTVVLLVDDVMTTGVTTTMIQEQLMPAQVLTITLAKTASAK